MSSCMQVRICPHIHCKCINMQIELIRSRNIVRRLIRFIRVSFAPSKARAWQSFSRNVFYINMLLTVTYFLWTCLRSFEILLGNCVQEYGRVILKYNFKFNNSYKIKEIRIVNSSNLTVLEMFCVLWIYNFIFRAIISFICTQKWKSFNIQ